MRPQVPPTVLVRCFHPIFHTAGGGVLALSEGSAQPLPPAANASPGAESPPGGAADQPTGKLGSLQARPPPQASLLFRILRACQRPEDSSGRKIVAAPGMPASPLLAFRRLWVMRAGLAGGQRLCVAAGAGVRGA